MSSDPTEGSGSQSWIYAVVLGLGGAILEHGPIGLVTGAAIGYLLGRVIHLDRRLGALRRRQDAWEAEAKHPLAVREVAPAVPREPVIVPPAASPPPSAAVEPPPPFAESPSQVRPLPQSPPRAVPPPAPRKPGVLDQAWTWFKGGNPLARAGIVILFFGLAFLAKYASDHAMLPLEARFALIATTGLSLLVVGWRLRERRALYAHLLQGGGVAALYLTVFAATRLYHLLPVSAALGLMVLIAATGAVLAVAQNSLPLAVLGTAGGFLAPLLISTGSGNHIALFTYYSILNLGVFAMSWFRTWRVLNLVGFVFTFGIVGLFRAAAFAPEKRWSTVGFLAFFFLIYAGISVLFSLRQKPNLRGYVSASLVFGLPVAVLGLLASLVRDVPFALAWSAIAIGAFYLLLGTWLYRQRNDNVRLLSEAFAALGVIFGSMAIPLAFDHRTTSAMWAIEGAGLLWLGVRQDRLIARVFGTLLQLLAGAAYFARFEVPDGWPLLNAIYLGQVLIAGAGMLSAWWLQRNTAGLKKWEAWLSSTFLLWGLVWWLAGTLEEMGRGWPPVATGGMLLFLAINVTGGWAVSRRLDWPALGRTAFALILPAVLLGLGRSIDHGHPAAQAAWIGWPVLLGVWYQVLWKIDHETVDGFAPALPMAHVGSLLLLAGLVSWELSWQIDQYADGIWPGLAWGVVPAALLWMLGSTRPWPAWPVARHAEHYRGLAGWILLAIAGSWTLVINLASDGDPVPLPYVVLFNPLDLAVAVVLMAAVRYLVSRDRFGSLRQGDRRAQLLVMGIAALVFLWMNAMLARALHWYLPLPLDLRAFTGSTIAQSAFSVFWSVIGVITMITASRRRWRGVWIAGVALMAIVVVKLFLVDTANSGTLARVFSFMTVGVLLLVVGYVSPLPPATGETAEEEVAS